MKEIIISVPDSKYKFFIELVNKLGFAKVKEQVPGDSVEDILRNIQQGFVEMKQIQEGKLKTTPAKEVLDEL